MITVGLCNIINSLFYWNFTAMVEKMYEQSPDYFNLFRKNYKIFVLNHEPHFSGFASNANFAVSSHSKKFDFCNLSIDNEKLYHVLFEFTKESTDLINQIASKAFVIPCLLSTIKFLILGSSNYQLSGPLMEKLKITVNFNSINNINGCGVPVRRRLPQVCFGAQTKSVQTRTDMSTNVTIERFINFLNGENAAEFSRKTVITLSGYGCIKIDSNTLFVKFIMKQKFKF